MDKRQTNKRKSPVFYRTSSPSGPLPCFLSLQITIMQSRATGIADHILPLGDLFCSRLLPFLSSITAPPDPHTTGLVVYLAFFNCKRVYILHEFLLDDKIFSPCNIMVTD